MIFDTKHNELINLMLQMSGKLSRAFNDLITYLPNSVTKKCQNFQEFEEEIDDIIYSLEYLEKKGKWEFKVEDLNNGTTFTLQFKEFTQKDIAELENSNNLPTYKIGKFLFELENSETSYNFELTKNENNEYVIGMQRFIVTRFEDILDKEKEMKIDLNSYINLAKTNTSKR